MFTRCLIVMMFCISLMGCVEQKFWERQGVNKSEILQTQAGLSLDWVHQKRESVTWNKALELQKKNNLVLRQSQIRLYDLQGEKEHFFWRQLDPRLIAYVNFNAVLGQLSSLSSDGFGASLLGSVNVPDPVGLYARRYALELQIYQTLLNNEQTKRNLRASLYALFLQQKELDENKENNVKAELASEGGSLERLVNQERQNTFIQVQQERLWVQINKTLNTPGHFWMLDYSSLPSISYASKMDHLDNLKGYARLAVYQVAGQLEMANARIWQVKFSQLPRVSQGVSLPQIYSNSENQDFDYQNIGLFTSLSRSIEFTGRRKRDKKSARQQLEHVRQTTVSRLEEEMVRFNQSKKAYRYLLTKKKLLKDQADFLIRHSPKGGGEVMLKYLKELKTLNIQIRQNQRELARMDLRFWVWDDQYWGLPF